MPAAATQAAALRSKTTHAFVMRAGYIAFAPQERLPFGPHKGLNCSPTIGTADGSAHLLTPPGGTPLVFTWVAAESAWERFGGRRMAFGDKYLASHGWTYVGPT